MSSSNPQAVTCKNEGDALYRDKKYHVAVMKYTQAINLLHPQGLTPNDESTFQTLYLSYSNRCACFLQINRTDQALQDAKQCIKLKPDWPKGYTRLATCYHKLGQLPNAIAAYEQVLKLDNTNEEARQAIQRIKQQQNRPSGASTASNNSPPPQHGDAPSFMQQAQQYLQSINWRGHMQNAQLQINQLYSKIIMWWVSLSPEMQRYIQIGAVAIAAYYFFFYRSSYGGGGYHHDTYASPLDEPLGREYPHHEYRPRDRYSSYHHHSYSSGYNYGGGGGMSWLTWGGIMYAAYALPPMFPEQLGPMYARPFFGMSWTTFMWLLNMVSRNGGGIPFVGGGFGRPMFGGGFGNRRRY